MKPFSRRPCENQLSATASQPRLFYRLTLSSLGLVTEGRPCATERVVGLSRPPSSKNRAVSPLRTEECAHPRMLDAMWGAPPTRLNTLTFLRSAPCPTWKLLDVGECNCFVQPSRLLSDFRREARHRDPQTRRAVLASPSMPMRVPRLH